MDNPQLYTKGNIVQGVDAEKFLNYFGDLIKTKYGNDAITLIDIGSGCGTVLSEVIVGKSGLNFTKVVGVDVTKEMVEFSNKKFGNSIMSFQLMNVEGEIPDGLKTQQFDMASSMNCLFWIKDLKKAFRNIHELLKPDAYLCCNFYQHFVMIDVWTKLEQKYPLVLKDWKKKLTQLWFFENPEEVMKEYLKITGFKVVGFVDAKDDKHNLLNEDCFVRTMKSTNPFKFTNEIEETEYFKDALDVFYSVVQEGTFTTPARIMYFVAQKC